MSRERPFARIYFRYKDWAPTPHDLKGFCLPDRQDWRVVGFRSRDTLERNVRFNEKLARRAAAQDAGLVEVHRFGHWACGWFEIILQSPDYHKWARRNRGGSKWAQSSTTPSS